MRKLPPWNSTVFKQEYLNWRKYMRELKPVKKVLPVSIHAENVERELKDMLTTEYRESGGSFIVAFTSFVLWVMGTVIAKINKYEWDNRPRE